MKKLHAWIVYTCFALGPSAQGTLSDFTVIERGAHHRVWERNEIVKLPDGTTRTQPHRVVEMAAGLHYRGQNGEWLDSQEEIEILPDGAAARKGPHKVHFNGNLNSVGAISHTTSDGKVLRSHVVAIAYTDPVTGQSVIVGRVKDCQGVLLPPNKVLYENAFTDIDAAVLFTYTRSTIEQDVILRQSPLPPERYGLSPDSLLEVWTSFDAPEPMKRSQTVSSMTDQSLDFGAMRILRGHAFGLDAPMGRMRGIPVVKTWLQDRNNKFLIESVRHKSLKNELAKLPPLQAAVPGDKNSRIALLRDIAVPQAAAATPVRMAMNLPPLDKTQGLVLDYVAYEGYIDPVTFQGNITYLITGMTWFWSGPVVFEAGTVIKFSGFAGGSPPSLQTDADFVFETDDYRPAIFTSRNDNSVGENTYSAGSPTNYYVALVSYSTNNLDFKNLRIRYGLAGLWIEGPRRLRNAELIDCEWAIYVPDGSSPTLPRYSLATRFRYAREISPFTKPKR